jgi:ABC-type nitrate/sulfonate/bicarbonate transport system substrate-binding protein
MVMAFGAGLTRGAQLLTHRTIGLKGAGMSEQDVTLVNAKTNETPQVLASGQVDAIGAWQPVSGSAMKALPGSRPIYTSAQAPGLIYDVLYASPTSLNAHRSDYVKLAKVWDHVVSYINDPKTQDDAVKIMSARVGLTPAALRPLTARSRAPRPRAAHHPRAFDRIRSICLRPAKSQPRSTSPSRRRRQPRTASGCIKASGTAFRSFSGAS